MKQATLALSILSFIGVIVLFGMNMSNKKTTATSTTTATTATPAQPSGRIAYVDIDTFEAHYTLLKSKKEDFAKRQSAMEAELQRSGQQLQNDAMEFQKKAEAHAFTEAEGQSAQKRLQQMQQSLETRKQAMSTQLQSELEGFNTGLQKELDSFLQEYNKEHHYDFVLSYAHSGSILYANKALNITQDVIKGMNANAAAADTSKSK